MEMRCKSRQIRRLAGLKLILAVVVFSLVIGCAPENELRPPYPPNEIEIKLPEPRDDSETSIEQVLLDRRSVRNYTGESLTLEQVSQLLWSAQGVTDPRGFRTAPSAGATYPLETYVIAGNVDNLAEGVYRYNPARHELVKVLGGDLRKSLAQAALGQSWVEDGAINIVFTAVYERTTQRYGERGKRYVHMEAGHAAQNVYLQSAALNLGTVVIGAFHDDQVREILGLPEQEQPLYIMPVGRS